VKRVPTLRDGRWATSSGQTVTRGERGSGSLLGLAIVGSIAAVAMLSVPLYLGLSRRQSVEGAADAAALAAADVAAGVSPGIPCEVARRVGAANGASIGRCDIDGLVVTVESSTTFLGLRLRATATAGPPDAVTN
jgi:secretion/DNA translocation related TadE-like protein